MDRVWKFCERFRDSPQFPTWNKRVEETIRRDKDMCPEARELVARLGYLSPAETTPLCPVLEEDV